MRRPTLHLAPLCGVVAVVAAACGKSETKAADTTTPAAVSAPASPAATAPTTPVAAIAYKDVAGKWNMRAVPDSGDTTTTTYVMTAGADSTGWTIRFPNGLEVPVHPMASGDSITYHAGPYASVRRKGLQVTTDGAFRKQGDTLVGTTIAHYKTTKPDSVLHLHVRGTKAP